MRYAYIPAMALLPLLLGGCSIPKSPGNQSGEGSPAPLSSLPIAANAEGYVGDEPEEIVYEEAIDGYRCLLAGQSTASYRAHLKTNRTTGDLLLGGDLCTAGTQIIAASELTISRYNPSYVGYQGKLFENHEPYSPVAVGTEPVVTLAWCRWPGPGNQGTDVMIYQERASRKIFGTLLISPETDLTKVRRVAPFPVDGSRSGATAVYRRGTFTLSVTTTGAGSTARLDATIDGKPLSAPALPCLIK